MSRPLRPLLKIAFHIGCAAALVRLAACVAAPTAESKPAGAVPRPTNPCRLILPEQIPVAVGREANIYFDNVVLVANWRNYVFNVDCAKGTQQEERWTFVPQAGDAGEYPLTLEVFDGENRLLASEKTTIRVVPADAGAGREVTLLIIGDSLTHASVYPEEMLNLCKAPGNPHLTLLGTHHLDGTSPENRHEGYGGWTFERFVAHYDKAGPEAHQGRGSPFVFMEDGKPTFDFRRYVQEQCGGKTPDFVSIALGCNDTFGATEQNLEATVDRVLGYADKLVAGIRAAGPGTRIGLVTLVPPAASQDAFGANYQCTQTRWQYRRNQHRVVERMKERCGGREGEGLYLIPAYVDLDTVHNYPAQEGPANARATARVTRQANGVHPAAEGYRQMADVIYSWMKAVLAAR